MPDGDELGQTACASRRARRARRSVAPTSSAAASVIRRSDGRQVELGADDHHRVEQPPQLSRRRRTRTIATSADARDGHATSVGGQTASTGRWIVRVFLLDDHEVVRRGVRDLLEAEGDIEVVGEAGTAEEALGRIPIADPDVAVLDVRLPDGSGVEVCREIRSQHPEIALPDAHVVRRRRGAVRRDHGRRGRLRAQAGARRATSSRRCDASRAGESLLDPSLTARVIERLRQPRPRTSGSRRSPPRSGASSTCSPTA